MGTDALGDQRRHDFACHSDVLRDDAVYSEPCERLLRPSQKDCIVPVPSGYEASQRYRRRWPQWAKPDLVTLAMNADFTDCGQ